MSATIRLTIDSDQHTSTLKSCIRILFWVFVSKIFDANFNQTSKEKSSSFASFAISTRNTIAGGTVPRRSRSSTFN
eukprot:scaffold256790_cov30-Tisochrysis_lutea.AAC.1